MYSYILGRREVLLKLGLDAEDFTQLMQQADTAESPDQDVTRIDQEKNIDKTPAWGGQSSMESGDAGTRNYQMGIPRSGVV